MGQRPVTRAEALLIMLENNSCPPEQLQTLRNTVQNQDVKAIAPEDHVVEQKKRGDRRIAINRPKKSIKFNLDNNATREFRISDVVQSDERVIRSGERDQPVTPSRLVKLEPMPEASPDDQTASPQKSETPKETEIEKKTEESFETQSGDGSNSDKAERERGTESTAEILSTLSEINIDAKEKTKQPVSEQATSKIHEEADIKAE